MIQLKLAAGAFACAAAAHYAYVRRERRMSTELSPSLMRFTPGSNDAAIEDSLRTGDLVLFSRDCTLYVGCAGVVCAARQAAAPSSGFDQVGVIVRCGANGLGAPHILELTTAGGVRLRPYDARVRCSRSRRIAVVPLCGAPIDSDAARRARVEAIIEAASARDDTAHGWSSQSAMRAPLTGVSGAAVEIAGIASDPGVNASIDFALDVIDAVAGGSTAVSERQGRDKRSRVTMDDLVGRGRGASSRLAARGMSVGRLIWVRDLPR